MKNEDKPIYAFLTGGAGVGKTVLVKSLFQSLIRYFNKEPNSNPDNSKVLLAAPTGKQLSSSMEIPYTVYFRHQQIKDCLKNL